MLTDEQVKHKELLQANRAKISARKERTRRLIEHGAIAESFVEGSDSMDPETFKKQLQKLLTPTGRRMQPAPDKRDTIAGSDGKEMRTSNRSDPVAVIGDRLRRRLQASGYNGEMLNKFTKQIQGNLGQLIQKRTTTVRIRKDPVEDIRIVVYDNGFCDLEVV